MPRATTSRRGFLGLLLSAPLAAVNWSKAAVAAPRPLGATVASAWQAIGWYEQDFPGFGNHPASVGYAMTFRHQQTGELIRNAVRWNNYTGPGPERNAKRCRAKALLRAWADDLDASRAREAVERFDEMLVGRELWL